MDIQAGGGRVDEELLGEESPFVGLVALSLQPLFFYVLCRCPQKKALSPVGSQCEASRKRMCQKNYLLS